MGKHSLEDDRVFWRSVMFFALKWMGVVALPLIAAWGIWRLIREPNQNPVAPAVVSQESPTTVASPPPSPSPTAEPSPTSSPTTRGPVQVLNGSGQTGQARRAADRLEQAGFQIVAVG
ncbi:MAG: LytR C-terminal domain-containing protein, partial [Actinomycetota bacterium]